jgi:hypothetical protein
MSLAIDVDKICAVLLADGWHEIEWRNGTSIFEIDAYQYIRKRLSKHDEQESRVIGGQCEGVTAMGATWLDAATEGAWRYRV